MLKIYVASSWRNAFQPRVVEFLRSNCFDVYDFRSDGFNWRNIDPGWHNWTVDEYRGHLQHTLAVEGFKRDFDAMLLADIFVLVQPCGRSAHLELGWAVGQGKRTAILQLGHLEPELMFKMVDFIALDYEELLQWLVKG